MFKVLFSDKTRDDLKEMTMEIRTIITLHLNWYINKQMRKMREDCLETSVSNYCMVKLAEIWWLPNVNICRAIVWYDSNSECMIIKLTSAH